MTRLPKFITRTLSVQLSLMVVSAMAILMIASLIFMLHFSRKAIKEEALEKASQTLEGTVERIDNILLSVEQATGNIYYSMQPHLDQPDKINVYCRKLVESNPYIAGCVIAFKPGFYQDRENFIVYVHRDVSEGDSINKAVLTEESYGNTPYTEQAWFTEALSSGKPDWVNSKSKTDTAKEPIYAFCLPIPGDDNQPVGVIAVDVSLNLLSRIVLEMRPSPSVYCTLLEDDGSLIVHPDSNKLLSQTISTEAIQETDLNQTVSDAAKSMVSGETGYKQFRMNDTDYLVFYKPFQRSAVPGRSLENQGWSVGIIYPEDDIFGDYNRLLYYVVAIAIIGLLLLFVLSGAIIHRQLLPLRMLTKSAQHIAEGNYNEVIPDSRQHDEIGRLQNHFQQMQQSLSSRMGEMQRLSATLQERGEVLKAAYEQAQVAERMKTSFLYNMTNQMISPVNGIVSGVKTIREHYSDLTEEETKGLVAEIQLRGEKITALLNQLIADSERSEK